MVRRQGRRGAAAIADAFALADRDASDFFRPALPPAVRFEIAEVNYPAEGDPAGIRDLGTKTRTGTLRQVGAPRWTIRSLPWPTEYYQLAVSYPARASCGPAPRGDPVVSPILIYGPVDRATTPAQESGGVWVILAARCWAAVGCAVRTAEVRFATTTSRVRPEL